jgi:hypothetical protein
MGSGGMRRCRCTLPRALATDVSSRSHACSRAVDGAGWDRSRWFSVNLPPAVTSARRDVRKPVSAGSSFGSTPGISRLQSL